MSSTISPVSILTKVYYHPAENRLVSVDFAKQVDGPLASPTVVVQSQDSEGETPPSPNIEAEAVSGTVVSFKLNNPEMDTYKLRIKATDPAAGDVVAVLTVVVSSE